MAVALSGRHAGGMNATTADPQSDDTTAQGTTGQSGSTGHGADDEGRQAAAGSGAGSMYGPPELCRPFRGRMLAGVAAGLADYFGIDVTIVRIAFVVLAVAGGAGIPLYLAGWLLMPDEGDDTSIAGRVIQSHARSY
jgi:phage shock protein PspC (stress-responsive transcriptional regulator)